MVYLISGVLIVAILICAYKIIFPSRALKSRPKFHNADLIKVLLNLEEKQLNELLELYKIEFGQNAARYARQTYRKWKAGEVRPNKQTFNRLLVHLPEVMSFDLKCEVLRELREAYCAKDNYELTVYTDDWKDKLNPLVTSIIDKAYTAQLPAQVEKRLQWLSGNEMRVANALLAESQAQESRNAFSLLEQEISNIEQMLADTEGTRRKVTHKLKLPCGTITLKIKRR
jgi:hypothetical protein